VVNLVGGAAGAWRRMRQASREWWLSPALRQKISGPSGAQTNAGATTPDFL
jgi:hypothetical protein